MRIFSMFDRSTLHCAILPKRSESVIRVVAVKRGSELSLLLDSSDPLDGERGRDRRFGSPSILTRARSFSALLSLWCFLWPVPDELDDAAGCAVCDDEDAAPDTAAS